MRGDRVEINLVVCLQTLLVEKSVTRAAQRMGMTQSGMSNALARLRHLTKDPLLVQVGRRMELTPHAMGLVQHVNAGLLSMEQIFSNTSMFEPQTVEASLVVAMVDSMAMMLGPPLLERVDREAPGLTVTIQKLDQDKIVSQLSDGTCDLAIGYLPKVPDSMFANELISQTVSIVRSATHPLIGKRLSFDQYLASRHVLSSTSKWLESSVTQSLLALGVERKIGARVHSNLLAASLAARTSMLCAMPTWIARQSATWLPLTIHPLPFKAPDLRNHLVWHQRTQHRGLQYWFRNLIREAAFEAATGRSSGMNIPRVT